MRPVRFRSRADAVVLRALGLPVRTPDAGIGWVWPADQQKKRQRPLILRLITLTDERNRTMHLLTNVLEAGRLSDAAAARARLVAPGESGKYDHSRPFPAEIVGDQARMNLAACYARIGRPADARALFTRLLNHPRMGADAARNLRVLG